jgi:pantetheine-phosphate adenylyltransferase
VTTVLYPGSFDPIHYGHLDVIESAADLFGHVVVAAMVNPAKTDPLFDLDARREMLTDAVAHVANVSIELRTGLVVDVARDLGVDFIIKGLRTATDFEFEMQMAQTNRAVSGVRTVFLPSTSEHGFVTSTFIRDIARYGGDVSTLVPPSVHRHLMRALGR